MQKTQICTYIKSFFKNHLNISSFYMGCIHITYNQMLFEICLHHDLNISEIMHVHSLFVNLQMLVFVVSKQLVKSLTIPQEGIHFVVCRKHKSPYYAILGQEGKECNRRKFRNFPFSDVG
jgi:hypothetical protein